MRARSNHPIVEIRGLKWPRRATAVAVAHVLGEDEVDVNLGHVASQIGQPTLVLHGTADRMVLPSDGEKLARAIRLVRFQLIPGGPHWVVHRSNEGRQAAI